MDANYIHYNSSMNEPKNENEQSSQNPSIQNSGKKKEEKKANKNYEIQQKF